MTSIEGFAPLFKRCDYNKPFSSVKIFKGLSSSFVTSMSRDELYLAWFDYDFMLNDVVVNDVIGLISTVRPGSVIVVTLDIDKPTGIEDEKPRTYERRYKADLPSFATAGLTWRDFKADNREGTLRTILDRAVRRGLRGRKDITFEYLLWITYADGHRMMSMAGVVADAAARDQISGAVLDNLWFVRRTLNDPVDIPRLVFTRKETLHLEQSFPDGKAAVKRIGLSEDDVDALSGYYRYWPSYTEAVV